MEIENEAKKFQKTIRVAVKSNHQNDENLKNIFIMETFKIQMLL